MGESAGAIAVKTNFTSLDKRGDRDVGTVAMVGALAGLAVSPSTASNLAQQRALHEARVSLMLERWDPSWGSPEDFVHWAIVLNAQGKLSPELAGAAQVYSGNAH
jgi:hypothetical protein